MKKTRFERFMVSLTTKALAEQTLETYEDHLKFVRISIEMELLKKGSKKIASKKTRPGKRKRDQVSSVLGKIKHGLIWTGSVVKRAGVFLGEGRNATYVFMGAIFAYAIIVMMLEMI